MTHPLDIYLMLWHLLHIYIWEVECCLVRLPAFCCSTLNCCLALQSVISFRGGPGKLSGTAPWWVSPFPGLCLLVLLPKSFSGLSRGHDRHSLAVKSSAVFCVCLLSAAALLTAACLRAFKGRRQGPVQGSLMAFLRSFKGLLNGFSKAF